MAVLGLVACAWWLYAHDPVEFSQRRDGLLIAYNAERAQAAQVREGIDKTIAGLEADLRAEEERSVAASRAIEMHRSLESTWKRMFGDSQQQELNDKRREEQEAIKADAVAKMGALKEQLTGEFFKQEKADVVLARIDEKVTRTLSETTKWRHYAHAVWDAGEWWVIGFVAFWIVWPVLRRALFYYFVAPFVVRRKPLRLSTRTDIMPALNNGGVVVTVELWPGEMLRVKPAFVESADSGLAHGKRFWLSIRFAITNVACGLVQLAELRNAHAGTKQRVFLQGTNKRPKTNVSDNDPEPQPSPAITDAKAHDKTIKRRRVRRTELAVVQVPEGGSLVLRPRYLAGVVQAIDTPLVIRSHWRFFSWHAWVTGQFRFLEFSGPCRLIVASQRGVQAEVLEPREDGRRPVRRANVWATIGFTPALRYRPARAESFWSYCRGISPLYDDLFIGTGLFFVQKTAIGQGRYDKGWWRQFVAGWWRNFQKVFGM